MKPTLPSKRSSFRTFIENEGENILEVKRGDNYLVYEINDDGTFKLLTKTNQPYQTTEEDCIYYLDYMSLEALRTHDLLTNNYDYSELKNNILKMISSLNNDKDISMEDMYALSDVKDCLKQLVLFGLDDEVSDYSSFIKIIDLFEDEIINSYPNKEELLAFLPKLIGILDSLSDN